MDEPGTGEPGELHHIDVAGVVVVMPGDEAGQHSGIGRLHIRATSVSLALRNGGHAEAFQHLDMGMAASHQHQFRRHGLRLSHFSSPVPVVAVANVT